ERWREITAGEVEYAPYQEIAERFPEIPREQFQNSVVYIDKTGQVFVAAEAVYQSLRCRRSKKWLWWSYQHIPGFAAVSEFGYNVIARHRGFASAITRLLWGKDVRPPSYVWAHRWFLRALGLVYLIAFVSLWIQVDGLVGADGILPISDYLSLARGLVEFKQHLPPFSLRRRRSALAPADLSNCSSYFVGCAFRFLSLAQHRRPSVS